MALQLDLFLTPIEAEIDSLKKNYVQIEKTLTKIRRGTYAEINSLKKVCVELSARQDIIERFICKK